ncbi:iron-containing alcohol dehydrogenase [Oceanicella sp. SM1341]|uniref:iron-containing alcohol dehydrogenase n=1 Tax=Oceanicella sp. SM1341 TaxID=1548889 RepID=UPI000E4BF221|nr:iron-containing alcohol dehydrogenase [Oceanicella sp. SM1341]
MSFVFQTTRSVLCEPGSSARIGELAAGLGCRKVAFITDRTVLELGLAAAALNGLKAAGIEVWVCAEVQPDPPESILLAAVEEAKRQGVDGVVSVGGGSSMDTAKLVAVLTRAEQPLSQMYGVGLVTGERLPLILAPTTAGTGSEVTPISIITIGENDKKGVVSPQLLPDWAVLDAELTMGLPRAVTAATGIDAMVHAIEAYTTKLKKNPVSDCLAREALRLLAGNIRTACFEPGNVEARSNMLLGSMLAGMAFANAPCAAVHALAYPLGGFFHVPHGLSNALVLPFVLDYNMPVAETLYDEIAPIIFPGKRGADLPGAFVALREELGMPTTLREVGISHNHLPMMVENAMTQTRLLVNNPREMTPEAALDVYEKAL